MNERAQLDALLVEYEGLLSDERSYTTTIATLASVALALVAFVAAGALGSDTVPVCKSESSGECTYFRLFSPLAPLVIVLYVEVIGVIAAIRSFQLRLVEERIRHLLPAEDLTRPPIASYVTTMLGFTSLRRGARSFRAIYFTILMILATLFMGVVGFALSKIEPDTPRLAGYAFYSAMGVVIFGTAIAWLGSGPALWQRTFDRALPRYGERMSETLAQRKPPLTAGALGYLLLPRPLDLVKGLCTLGAGGFVLLSHPAHAHIGAAGDAVVHLLVVVALFEFLAYQARYQWNDIYDLRSDLEHPARELRRRLTVVVDAVGVERAVKLSLSVATLRLLVLAVLAVATLPPRDLWLLLGAAALTFVIAVPYQWLRARTGSVAAKGWAGLHHLIYVHVGLGYALRAALGALLVARHLSPISLVLVPLAVLLFGAMFVTMAWALEGTSSLESSAPNVTFHDAIPGKPHIAPLTVAAASGRRVPAVPARWRILRAISDRRLGLIWNRLLLGAAITGALAAASLSDWSTPPLAIGCVLTAGVAAVWLLNSSTTTLSMYLVLAAVAGAAAAIASAFPRDRNQIILAFALLEAFFLTYVQFRNVSYDDLFAAYAGMQRFLNSVANLRRFAKIALVTALLGRQTLSLIETRRPKRAGRDAAPAKHREEPPHQGFGRQHEEATRFVASDYDDAWCIFGRLAPTTLVIDVEPFVCVWGTGEEALRTGIDRVLDGLLHIHSLRVIVFATNSARALGADVLAATAVEARYVTRARKPLSGRLELRTVDGLIVVCGDQVLTDGLLAWQLGAVFVQVPTPPTAPLWVRVQSALGRLAAPLLFTTHRG